MPVISFSGSQSPGSGIWAQIQQQQAQRNADQAAQQASALQTKAREAQTVADRAQETARSLKVQSTQAQGEAESAKRGLAGMASLGDTQTKLSSLREQIKAVIAPQEATAAKAASTVATTATVAPVVNAYGQSTGALVNVMA
jgi:hypothetical protein